MADERLLAEQRFPELSDFELEMELPHGTWTTIRANEDERAAVILADSSAISSMLCGGYRSVVRDDVKTRFRLTPKAWLKHHHRERLQMARTAELFDKPVRPRIRRMHVIDSGHIEGERAARFYCERCETETAWVICNLTEQRRGVPCPICNQGYPLQPGEKQ